MKLTSKQRAYLMQLGANLSPVIQIGKDGVTPEAVKQTDDAFNTRELLKGTVLKTSPDEPAVAAEALAGRTRSTLVKVIGRKFLLYHPFRENPKIALPKAGAAAEE